MTWVWSPALKVTGQVHAIVPKGYCAILIEPVNDSLGSFLTFVNGRCTEICWISVSKQTQSTWCRTLTTERGSLRNKIWCALLLAHANSTLSRTHIRHWRSIFCPKCKPMNAEPHCDELTILKTFVLFWVLTAGKVCFMVTVHQWRHMTVGKCRSTEDELV